MRKILVMTALVVLLAGCRERSIFGILGVIDSDEIDRYLTQDVLMIPIPEDSGATVDIQLEAPLPAGLRGIAVYVDTFDLSGMSNDEIADKMVADSVTDDTVITVSNLVNGQGYFVEWRGIRDDEEITTIGIGGKFYPRPWGQGSYLGFNPNEPADSATNNAIAFNRATGDLTSHSLSDAVDAIDFICYYDAGTVYFTDAAGYGGYDNKVAAADKSGEKWLEVQEAPGVYNDTVPLALNEVYHFKTYDDYYGKFVIDTVIVDLINLTVSIEMKYAFQTAQGYEYY
ncbi:hypothetical protein JXM67_07490 [candidate division WOR-3 bacterium]|nr:hypothetical protein [candidate division WOR-3 bacterium]